MCFRRLILLLALLPMTACIELMEPPGEGGEPDGTAGSGGGTEEFFDGAGVCRSSLPVEASGCAHDFWAARALMPRCGWGCSGPCGDWLVYLDNCDPSRACAYDPLTHELRAATLEADAERYCGGRSTMLTFGDQLVRCQFDNYDPLMECVGSG